MTEQAEALYAKLMELPADDRDAILDRLQYNKWATRLRCKVCDQPCPMQCGSCEQPLCDRHFWNSSHGCWEQVPSWFSKDVPEVAPPAEPEAEGHQ